jgi:hypothetical protein
MVPRRRFYDGQVSAFARTMRGFMHSIPLRSILVPLAAASMFLAGCTDDPISGPPVATEGITPSVQLGQVPARVLPGEKAFHDLARDVPAFGGFFLDGDGSLVVHLTGLEHGRAMQAALVPFLQRLAAERGNPQGRIPRILYRKADFSFPQLSAWRDRVEDPLFAIEQVVLVDIDERDNRIFIGLTDEGGRAEAELLLRELRAPAGMIRVEVIGAALPQSGSAAGTASSDPGTCLHLQGICRPLMGGFQIAFGRDGGSPVILCTLGFTALVGNQPAFVTNAHCSDDEWNFDATLYHQPHADHRIGQEAADPNGWSCETSFKCRYSDANLVHASVATDVGYIARPTAIGSLTVSGTQPRFTVGASGDAYVGETVYMVGHVSGLQRGTVDKTCTSFKKTAELRWHKVLCSDVTDLNAAGGDSGSPMFLWNGSSDVVTLVGVLFARTGTYDHTFFSPMSGIRQDLGAMEVRAPGYRGVPDGRGGSGGGGGSSGECGGNTSDPTLIIEPC